jgi:hypothetical protein
MRYPFAAWLASQAASGCSGPLDSLRRYELAWVQHAGRGRQLPAVYLQVGAALGRGCQQRQLRLSGSSGSCPAPACRLDGQLPRRLPAQHPACLQPASSICPMACLHARKQERLALPLYRHNPCCPPPPLPPDTPRRTWTCWRRRRQRRPLAQPAPQQQQQRPRSC